MEFALSLGMGVKGIFSNSEGCGGRVSRHEAVLSTFNSSRDASLLTAKLCQGEVWQVELVYRTLIGSCARSNALLKIVNFLADAWIPWPKSMLPH